MGWCVRGGVEEKGGNGGQAAEVLRSLMGWCIQGGGRRRGWEWAGCRVAAL